jgi:hypothetical protein
MVHPKNIPSVLVEHRGHLRREQPHGQCPDKRQHKVSNYDQQGTAGSDSGLDAIRATTAKEECNSNQPKQIYNARAVAVKLRVPVATTARAIARMLLVSSNNPNQQTPSQHARDHVTYRTRETETYLA